MAKKKYSGRRLLLVALGGALAVASVSLLISPSPFYSLVSASSELFDIPLTDVPIDEHVDVGTGETVAVDKIEETKEDKMEEEKKEEKKEDFTLLAVTDEEEKWFHGLDEMEEQKVSSETHQYQAEVSRLMDIIINSLYTQKEVFLRELISNGADALERVRFLSVSDPGSDILESKSNLDIRIDFDKDFKTVSIQDSGIGMTKPDLINNLGTVAKSGTSNFLEALAAGGDVNLIGQFGVGFYSAFLVADKVTVCTKNNDDKQMIWVSKADGSYAIGEDPRGNTLGRGTRVTLHLKEDATEFLNESKLKDLVTRYSQFVAFPIYIKTEKTEKVTEEVEVKPEKEKEKEEDVDVTDEEKAPKRELKTVDKKVNKWELINTQKAIWLRPKEEIMDSEYNEFYKSLTKDWSEPLTHIHFSGEGEIEFKSILYIPSKAPMDMFENYFNKQTSIKLYVRRILVADQFDNLLPKYLHFVKGVVDSDDFPLNVSREQLQQHKIMKVISKKLGKKVLDLIKKMSKESEKTKSELQDKIDGAEDDEDKQKYKKLLEDTVTPFDKIWKEFSRNLKLGCYEDDSSRTKIANLLRFYTLKHPGTAIGLDQYTREMKEGQEVIYYASGESVSAMSKLPQLQMFSKKEIDVLFLTETMDEPCLQKITEYEGKKIQSVQKGDVQLSQTDEEKTREKKLKKMYAPLIKWWKEVVGDKVFKVEISKRLVDDPVAVVSSEWGYSAQMERIMKTQTFVDSQQLKMLTGQRILEFNPNHPVIKNLLAACLDETKREKAAEHARFLHYAGLIASGFDLDTPEEVSLLMYQIAGRDLGLKDMKVEEVDVSGIEDDEEKKEIPEDEEEEEEEEEEDSEDDNVEKKEKEEDAEGEGSVPKETTKEKEKETEEKGEKKKEKMEKKEEKDKMKEGKFEEL